MSATMSCGYIYIRTHPSYDIHNVYKMGRTDSILDRDSQYATGEFIRGRFKLVLGFNSEYSITDVELKLQNKFIHLNVKKDGGIEFYDKIIINQIEPYLTKNGINFKRLSEEEIDELERINRERVKKDESITQVPDVKKFSFSECYTPRKDQVSIINKAVKYFQVDKKGILVLTCGVGKTLISLWITQELKSNTILIGVPNKLLLYQWEKVICKLLKDVPLLIVFGKTTVKNIIHFIKNNRRGNYIIITTYSSSHKVCEATQQQQNTTNIKFDMKILDECFPFKTGIQTTDGVIKIGKLYEMFNEGRTEKMPLVLSFNESTKVFEYKKISYTWRKENNKLLKIQMGYKTIKCTENHRILTTTKGYIEAIKLKVNDLIISKYDVTNTINIDNVDGGGRGVAPCLNNDQLQLVYGSYLGNGKIIHTSPDNRLQLKLIHNSDAEQKEYCLWKANILDSNLINVYTFQSNIFDLDDYDVKNNDNSNTILFLDKINEKGLAIWFMDNGIVNKYNNSIYSIELVINKFNKVTINKFINKFKSYNINCCFSKVRNQQYCYLHFNKTNSIKLLNLINLYFCDNFIYKINDSYSNKYKWDNKFLEYGTLKITKITNINNNSCSDSKPYVYDLEIEDNHNFVIGEINDVRNNFVDGPVVHNCHHLTTTNKKISDRKKAFIKILDVPSNNQLALTATLKHVETNCISSEAADNTNIITVISNDSVDHFGTVIVRKCLLWTINKNIVCDYVIQTIIINDDEYIPVFGNIENLGNTKRLILSAFASLKSISNGHSHHLLVYSNSTANSLKLIGYIKLFLEEHYFDIPNLYYSTYDSKIDSTAQDQILKDFDKSEFGIISCVYCLGEGWDFPLLDGVVFAENMTSNIRIVQSALRASRKHSLRPTKITKIILPVLNSYEWLEDTNNPDLKKVREVVYQMGLEDETIIQKIKIFSLDIKKRNKLVSNRYNITDDVKNFGDYDEELTKKLRLATIKRSNFGTTYEKARKIIAGKNIRSKEEYYELCEKDIRLTLEPEITFKGVFTSWIEYLSIERIYYEFEECVKKIQKYLSLHPELKEHYLDLSYVTIELCKLDTSFPPSDLWTDYYNVKNLQKIIINNRKKRR
jgi:superfamily II DNA or RNA helicase